MFLSVFDIFKIGIGPSSSHTMGPMLAAARFLNRVDERSREHPTAAIVAALAVTLHGSLAFTGIGHATDRAIILGLSGLRPDTIDPDEAARVEVVVRATGLVCPPGHPSYRFRPAQDLHFDRKTRLPLHSNGMQFSAFDGDGALLLHEIYYSIGGGFVASGEELTTTKARAGAGQQVPFPFRTSAEMLEMSQRSGLGIAAMQRANEETVRRKDEVDDGLDTLWRAMEACIERGLNQRGVLPGPLSVERRASALHERLDRAAFANSRGATEAGDWLAVYAMAVNEENAAGGRVVTAPTNGAAGVIPAILQYYLRFRDHAGPSVVRDGLLTAAAIGSIIKNNASISGAEMGCQGEIGSASAMAAAALCALLDGTPAQIENAAEIALEHHLGMTCDPVGGLVQIPCIERNAFGAAKALLAASLALKGDGRHVVSLDACVETMRQTGNDMNERYKETSLGGLAVNVVEC